MRICKRNRPFKKQEPLPHKFEWIEMDIAKNREEYCLMKTVKNKQHDNNNDHLIHSKHDIKPCSECLCEGMTLSPRHV